MHASTQRRVVELYSVFSIFSRPNHMDSCECCHTEADKAFLVNSKLSDLTEDHLSDFVFSAFTTIGDTNNFLYFLPRILELAFKDGYSIFELGLLGHKIYQTKYWNHNDKVSEVVDRALLSHFEHTILKCDSSESQLTDWVCCIGNATPNIEPFLDLLFESPTLKEFYDYENKHAVKGNLSDAFWEDNHGNRSKIVAWLLSDKVVAKYWTFYQ